MAHLTFPEDSTLKRHFESTVEMKRQRWLQQAPSDSTLNRHAMSANNQARSTAETASTVSAKLSSVAQNRTTVGSAEEKPSEKGFLAKLFSLFTRSA